MTLHFYGMTPDAALVIVSRRLLCGANVPYTGPVLWDGGGWRDRSALLESFTAGAA